MLGTFLVRSGVLTSVHTFASDPGRGVFILAILVFFIGGGFALYAWRAPMLKQGGLFAPVSREGALVINNLFIAAACATVFVGTLYPLALEALTGAKISVGAPFFELTFVPLAVILLLMLPFGHTLAWKRGDLLGAAQRLLVAVGIGILAAAATRAAFGEAPLLAVLGVGLGIFLIAGSINEIVTRSWGRDVPLSTAVRRAAGLPRSAWGAALAHAGVGVTVLGLSAQAWSVERLITAKIGDDIEVASYVLQLERVFPRTGPNYREEVVHFTVSRNGELVDEIDAAKRQYPARNSGTTEAGIVTSASAKSTSAPATSMPAPSACAFIGSHSCCSSGLAQSSWRRAAPCR